LLFALLFILCRWVHSYNNRSPFFFIVSFWVSNAHTLALNWCLNFEIKCEKNGRKAKKKEKRNSTDSLSLSLVFILRFLLVSRLASLLRQRTTNAIERPFTTIPCAMMMRHAEGFF
jgi:hypothetical protein